MCHEFTVDENNEVVKEATYYAEEKKPEKREDIRRVREKIEKFRTQSALKEAKERTKKSEGIYKKQKV